MTISRRKFIKNTAATLISVPFISAKNVMGSIYPNDTLGVHLFSKHLQFLDIKDASMITAELGFDGMDITVRPKGHILPKNVKSELPKAIHQIQEAGIACKLITTAISDAAYVEDISVIKTAAEEGVKYYRSNWFKYPDDRSMEDAIQHFQQKVKALGELNKQHGIIGCYQNHAGTKIGASYWELNQLLKSANPEYFGTQYDIRHATVEGGLSWKNGIRLLNKSIKTIVLKDFKWSKVGGQWKVVNVPIGEGMVDFKSYFKLLKRYGLNPPATLHLEYPLGGAEKGRYEITIDKKIVYEAMRNDLKAIQSIWQMA